MWEFDYTYIRDWVATLEQGALEGLTAAVEILEQAGPTLGRPLVDKVENSRHSNMKELRAPSPGQSEIRVLFAFDPNRMAILLLGGDKSGTTTAKAHNKDKWSNWYKTAIPEADRRYDEHLKALEGNNGNSKEDNGKRKDGSDGHAEL